MYKRIQEKIENIARQHRLLEGVIVTILFAALVLGVTVGLGTITSGWHFVDDHELLEWTNPIRSGQMTLAEFAAQLFPTDYAARFRPLYYPIRLLTIQVLGNNLVAYGILKALESILGMVLLYYVGRTCGGSACASFLFSLLSLTGYQAAVWWKLGPQEPQGVLYFALGMLLLNLYLQNGKKSLAVLSWVSLLIMCNWKESFIVLMPFVILYVLYRSMPEEGTLWQRILAGLRVHWCYLAASAILFTVIVLIIVFAVGTNNSSGAGISASLGIGTIISSYQWAFTHDLKYYYLVTLIVTAVLLTYWEQLRQMWMEILLFAAFLLPNLLLYGKEAMAERYIIPSSIGWGLFYVIAVQRKGFLSGKRRAVYVLALLALFALGLRSTIIEADYYRFRGESVTTAMEYASDAADQGSKTLSCFSYSNPEAQWTMDAWMEYNGHLDDMYYWMEDDSSIYPASSYAGEDGVFKEAESISLDEIDVVMAYNSSDRHYTGSCELMRDGVLEESFTKVTCGSVDIYVRNGSGLELPDGDIAYPIYY